VPLTYGELRTIVEGERLGWLPPQHLADDDVVPEPGLGAAQDDLLLSDRAAPVNFSSFGPGPNAHVAVRRMALGVVAPDAVEDAFDRTALRRAGFEETLAGMQRGGSPLADAPPAGAPPSSVDWRARWGQNWITSVRDQNPCNACWAFAGVALVESMVRIEHAMWTRCSEGDVHRGVGKTCPDLGNMGEVSTFFAANGFCDPGSWPWRTDSPPYAPTPDRNGRSVRGPAFTSVSVADTKTWLDGVGPLVAFIDVYRDFSGVGSGVYRRSTAPENVLRGGHLFLIVGYDDGLGAWLCKNSWGAGWGNGGFGWIAYGECNIDRFARSGLRGVNPDPWTKRRLHNGNLYESGNGRLHRNLEVAGADGRRVQHRWREGQPPWSWGAGAAFASDAAVCPTLIGTTFNRNMELVYTTTGGRLHHWWAGGGGGPWHDGGVFGPSGCTGVPGFVQSDYGAPGNFEVVVSVGGGRLQHVWRDGAGWHLGAVFGSAIARSGPSLVQGSYGRPHGNLECVATRTDGTMQHFWRNEATLVWNAGPVFGAGVTSPPVMIQGQYGMRDDDGPHGNFELCVAVGGRVQHWWRANGAGGDGAWRRSAEFGRDVAAVAGLCQGSWGRNLEVIVLRTDRQLQHFWRDAAGWREGPVIGPA
jgi:hypothetical protein